MRLQSSLKQRRGNIIPLVAFGLVSLLGLVALAVDIGMIAIARNQCQNAADAASVAGCRAIDGDTTNNYNVDAAPTEAIQAAINNNVLGVAFQGNPNEDWDNVTLKPKVHPQEHHFISGQVEVEIGAYAYGYNDADLSKEGFQLQIPRTDASEPYSAVRATVTHQGGFSFARIFGMSAFDTGATATAIHRPRDVVIVLDLSGSMRFQSLPGRSYWGDRTHSMNPESIFPEFGPYSSKSSAALQGTSTYKTSSGEYYDPCNISTTSNSGPPILEYFFQNKLGEVPSSLNRAFTRAPDSYNKSPGGDNFLKENENKGSNYAKTLTDIVGSDSLEIAGFHRDGYDRYVGAGNFKGYTQGPGYWGKTWMIWPPDPRGADPAKNPSVAADQVDNGAKDWRQRFFLKQDYYSGNLGWMDHNALYWQTGNLERIHAPMHYSSDTWVREYNPGSGNVEWEKYNYKINYAAVLKWLDTDPKPFPPRLRAGRIKYYDAFPNYNDTTLNNRWWTTATDSLPNLNERFWKGYIDFVLGVVWRSSINSHNNGYWSSSLNGGRNLQRVIGNGRPYSWGSVQIRDIPNPDLTEDYSAETAATYAAGYNGWVSLQEYSSSSTAPKVGDYIQLGKVGPGNTVYVITDVANYDTSIPGNVKVDVKVDAPLLFDVDDDDPVDFYKASKGFPFRYMDFNDNPYRPKHHYWFGPMTLIDYLGNYNLDQFWWPGNVPEAQAWQAKIGIQTGIDEIRNNHPNDFVGLTFFSNPKYSRTGSGQHNMAVVPLGRSYNMLKDSLWFPPSTITGGVTEITPWDADFEQVPRARGGTAPGMGFMIAYNLLSSSSNLRFYAEPQPQYKGVCGGLGRKGASRIVIFMTDGAPNTRAYRSVTGTGADAYYPIRIKVPNNHYDSKNVEWPWSGSYYNSEVYDVVKQITADTTANPPGYSTPRKQAKVYCIAYGTLFDPANASDPDQATALTFLQTIQYYGNTATTTSGANFPVSQRIYGDNATRITQIQQSITAILQGGVQVSLIE